MSTLNEMLQRLRIGGGDQDGRNVKGKLLSFYSALKNSYQAEWIIHKGIKRRCLLNPDKLKESYDQKEISIDFSADMRNGDYFFWPFDFRQQPRTEENILEYNDSEDHDNGTHWLVFMQDYAEEAYFRASARRCDHQIKVNDTMYWIYLKGPAQMELELGKNAGIEIAGMSYVLHLYITDNEETRAFFERLKIVKFDNHNWRISAVDRYTQKGIIMVYLEEYPDNPMEDAMIPPEIIEPSHEDPYIEGPQIIKYNKEYTYNIVGSISGGTFSVSSDKVKIIESTDGLCTIKIPKMVAFREYFDLIYRNGEIEIKLNILMDPM
jgi:hypothetical protein